MDGEYTAAWPYAALNTASGWQPGATKRIPWSGFLALVGAFCATVAAIAILVTSDGSVVSSWKYPPTVYLSIFYTLSNILIATAFSEAVTLNWWMKAVKDNTKLGDLHRYWLYGTAPMAALLSGRHFNFIAFAALFVAIAPVNGPLLQRSSSVGESTVSTLVNMTFPAAEVVVEGTGYISGRAYNIPIFTKNYNPVVQGYYRGDPIPAVDAGCPNKGKCSGRLVAAGLSAKCNSYTAPFDASPSAGGSGRMNFASTDVFVSTFGFSASSAPGNVTLDVQYKGDSPCSGDLTVRNCTLQAGTVRYPVIIDGSSNTIILDPESDIYEDEVLDIGQYANLMYGMESPIGGYAFALSNRFNARSSISFSGAAGFTLSSDGGTGPQFANQADMADYGTGMCNIKFDDPTPYLLQQARELMFRTAVAQGNSSTIQVIHPATEQKTASIYRTHYPYLAGAVAVNVCAIIIVITAFMGYWHLGRNVSLSPLEIAKAFNAPLLADQDSNGSASSFVKNVGDKAVRYGAVARTASINSAGTSQIWRDGELVELKPISMDGGSPRSSSPAAHVRHLEIANARIVEPLRT